MNGNMSRDSPTSLDQQATIPRRPSRPSIQTCSTTTHAQMTPPETPVSSRGSTDMDAAPPLFHNYIRAFYPYDPSSNPAGGDDTLLTTVAIKPGDLILVHSIHENGWADGTILTTGSRGWLPTNYCEAYDHPYLRNLLNAMTQFWDLLGANEEANLSTFVRQDYVRGLIAGVRYLLEHADCLHRDAKLVQQYTGIRRMRKGLLADLSSLVQIARNLQEMISEPFAGEVVHYLLEDLMTKAFKVVTRAIGFVDMWTKESHDQKLENSNRCFNQDPITPPIGVDRMTIDTKATQRPDVEHPVDSAKCFLNSPQKSEQAVGVSELPGTEATQTTRPMSAVIHTRAGSIAPRISLVGPDRAPMSGLASDELARTHDACISHIGAFIGYHLHFRPSAQLTQMTEKLLKACKNMLAISAEVYARDGHRSNPLRQLRDELQAKIDDLVQATQDVFRFSDGEDDGVVVMPQQSDCLGNIATGLIRVAAECVAKTRSLIEQIGDFQLDQLPSPLADPQPGEAESTERPDSRSISPSQPEPRILTSFEKRLSRKILPPAPPVRGASALSTASFDFGLEATGAATEGNSPKTPRSERLQKALPAIPSMQRRSEARMSQANISGVSLKSRPASNPEHSPVRKMSVGVSIAGSTNTSKSTSARDSGISSVSEVSTRATTPEQGRGRNSADPAMLNSFESMSSMHSATTEDTSDAQVHEAETQLLLKTFASELTFNKEGQVSGGSLPALIEQITPHDLAPDPQFLTAFYITFRLFTTPQEFAKGLMDRFDYIGEDKVVRLRIYNLFKGWLETYWNAEEDKDVLGDIRYFALHKLKPVLPAAGDRLVELIRKVSAAHHTGMVTGPLVSGVGKTSMTIGVQGEDGKSSPEPITTKSQLNALRAALTGGPACSILDFDPLEMARQLTLVTSQIFCAIRADELLSLDWNKPGTQKAKNVRAMTHMTDALAHVVADTVLAPAPTETKKRALIIKHWTKVATRCLEINNYDSTVAIVASLNNSMVRRLKHTWEMVSKKTMARLQDLNPLVDPSRNHGVLRKRLESPVAPCIPFLGIYLTDLTMLNEFPKKRDLPGCADGGSVINFDTYRWMAKVIAQIQRVQTPYHLRPVPELQAWMESHLSKMRGGGEEAHKLFYRRSLVVEPKRSDTVTMATTEERPRTAGGKERLEGFLRGGGFGFNRSNQVPEVPVVEVGAGAEREK